MGARTSRGGGGGGGGATDDFRPALSNLRDILLQEEADDLAAMNAEQNEAADAAGISAASRGGDCYTTAGRYVLDRAGDSNLRLVQGEVAGQGPLAGKRFGHSWVEDLSDKRMPIVIDRSNGRDITVPRVVYYGLGDVKKIHRYTPKQVAAKVSKHGYWGQWDFKTEL